MSEEECSFRMGDTVMLRSGGPVMTVVGKEAVGNGLWCKWFTTEHDIRLEPFPSFALIKASASK